MGSIDPSDEITTEEMVLTIALRNKLMEEHIEQGEPEERAQDMATVRLMVTGYRALIADVAEDMTDEIDKFMEGK